MGACKMVDINWTPQRGSSIPLHLQIYQYMKNKILNGDWSIGTKLPSQRALAKQFHVNRSTIVASLDELSADGLIEARVGRGTVVVNNTWSLLISPPPPDWNSYVQSGIHAPNMSLVQEINRAEADPAIIRLSTGELSQELLPNKMMEKVLRLKISETLSLGYSEPKGSLSLRKTVSEHLKTKGIVALPESILIVSGAIQALQLISVGLLKTGSVIFHETPSYLNSVHVFQSAGMRLLGIPLDGEGMMTHSIERLKRQHNGALLYTIPSYHNPTGMVMSEDRRKQLLEICKKEALPIIEDDVYGDLWFDSPPPKPLKSRDTQGTVLYIGSVSKSLSPGLRIGWIVGPEPVINRLADIKMQTDYGSSSLSQYAVEQWIKSGMYEEFLNEIRAQLRYRRDFTIQFLEKHFGDFATWNIPNGGFYIWLRLETAVSMRVLFERCLRENILINPGSIYDQTDQHHLRLSYSYASLADLEYGLMLLSELIRNLN